MTAQRESWIWLGGATLAMAVLFILPALVTIAPDDRASDSLKHIAERLGCDRADGARVFDRAYRPVDGPFGRWHSLDRLDCRDMDKAMMEFGDAVEESERLTALNHEINLEYGRAVEAQQAAKEAEEQARLDEDRAREREEDALRRNAELSAFVQTLQGTLDETEANLSQTAENLRSESARNDELRADLTDLTQTLNQRDQELSTTTIRLSTVSQELEQLHRIRDGLQTRQAELREEFATQTLALEVSQTRSAELEQQLFETSDALLETQTALDAVQTAYEASQQEIEGLNARITEIAGELSETQTALSDSEATVLARDQSLAIAAQEQTVVEQARDALGEELALTIQTLSNTESELFARIEALAAAENQIETLDREKAALELERDLYLQELGLFRGLARTVGTWEAMATDLSTNPTFARDGSALVIVADLFDPGSPDFKADAETQLSTLAQALLFLQDELPRDLDWAFLVRGHSDTGAISTERFPSNWELSAARAASVVRYLSEAGVAPGRLQVTGQGEFQPPSEGIGARRVTVDFQPLIYDLLLANTAN